MRFNLRDGQNAPSFSIGYLLITSRKFCLHSRNWPCAFPIFGLSCLKLRKIHVFIIFVFRGITVTSTFASSSQCRWPNLWENQQTITFSFLRRKDRIFVLAFGCVYACLYPPPPLTGHSHDRQIFKRLGHLYHNRSQSWVGQFIRKHLTLLLVGWLAKKWFTLYDIERKGPMRFKSTAILSSFH